MVNSSAQSEAMRQALSALMDGQADPGLADGACEAWRSSAQARECWHTYHLIGDVLRSDELVAPATRDAAFVTRLRERLADEPVPLAPAPLPAPQGGGLRHSRWTVPTAMAAGFVAVAGVIVVLRANAPVAPAATPAMAGAGQPDIVLVNGQLMRDARLDRYLSAHRQLSNGVAVQVPGAVVRSVDTIVLENK